MLKFLGGVVLWAVGQLGGALSFLPHTAQLVLQLVGGLFGVMGIHGAGTDPSALLMGWLDKLPAGWKTALGMSSRLARVRSGTVIMRRLPP